MPVRSARTSWKGTLEEGAGTVELASSGIGTYDVSFPRRSADEASGVTSPEELIAAAHSTCFAMQFSALLAGAGATNIALDVSADVSLGADPAGGFRIPGIALKVSGTADGIDADGFSSVAAEAKATCPVSKALTGTEISLDVSFGA